MRITVTKPQDGKVDISVVHRGAVLRFSRRLVGVDATNTEAALRPVLEEWERQKRAIRASASLEDG